MIDFPNSHQDSWFELVGFSAGNPPTAVLRGAHSRQFLYTSSSNDPIGHMLIGHGLQRFRIHIVGSTEDGTPLVRLQGNYSGRYVYSSSGTSPRVGSTTTTEHADTVFRMIRGPPIQASIWSRIDPSGVYWFLGSESGRYILSSSGGDQTLKDWDEPHGDTVFRIEVVDHEREIFRLKGVQSNKYMYSSSSPGGGVGHITQEHDDQQLRPYFLRDESGTVLLQIRGARSKKMLYSLSSETRLGHTNQLDHADTVFEVIPYQASGTPSPSHVPSHVPSPVPSTVPPSVPSPGTQPSDDNNGGFPTWAIILIIVAVVALLTTIVYFI